MTQLWGQQAPNDQESTQKSTKSEQSKKKKTQSDKQNQKTNNPFTQIPTKLYLAPADHSVDWLKRHGPLSLVASNTCSSCHTTSSCASCHAERGSILDVPHHPPGYIAQHSAAARLDSSDCSQCHNPQTFCAACHAQTKFLPDLEHAPTVRKNYHPPGWLDGSSNINHAKLARRNISDCASCHTERDCISCHQGISPHPNTFIMDCGPILRANPTTCAKCHTDIARLQMMCR